MENLKIPAGQALIYIVRPSFFGLAIKFTMFIGNKNIGYTKGKNYIYTFLEPGKYNFISKAENNSELELVVEADKTYYLEQKVSLGFIKSRNKLVLLDKSEGEIAKNKCKPSGSMEKK